MTFPLWLTSAEDGDDHGATVHARAMRLGRPDGTAQLPLDDRVLVDRVRAGEHAAMTTLVLTYYDGLARYADSLVHARDDAEDIAQEVLARVWEQRASWMPTTTVRAYLLGSIRNRVIDFRRQLNSRARRDAQAALPAQTLSTADNAVIDAEESAILRRAIGELPERWREVIDLRYGQGVTFREIGAVLHISEDAAKKVAQRAVGELRRKVGLS